MDQPNLSEMEQVNTSDTSQPSSPMAPVSGVHFLRTPTPQIGVGASPDSLSQVKVDGIPFRRGMPVPSLADQNVADTVTTAATVTTATTSNSVAMAATPSTASSLTTSSSGQGQTIYNEVFTSDITTYYIQRQGDWSLTSFQSDSDVTGRSLFTPKYTWGVYPVLYTFDATKLYRMQASVRKLPTYLITSSGGAATLKTSVSASTVNAVSYTASVQVNNTGAVALVVSDNYGHSQTVAAGKCTTVALTATGDGVTPIQIQFSTVNISDALSFYAGTPSIVRNDTGAQVLAAGDQTYSTWTANGGATMTYTAQSGSTVTVGLECFGSDKTTYVNFSGANSTSSQHYVCVNALATVAGTIWHKYVGFFKGFNTTSAGYYGSGNATGTGIPDDACKLNSNVRYFRPLFIVDQTSAQEFWEIDQISIDVMPDTLDAIANGLVYLKPKYVTSDGTFTVSTGLNPQGSIAPNQQIAFSGTFTDTSITFTLTSTSILRADGSSLSISGTVTYTSLTGGTTYYLYPYIVVATGALGMANPNPPGTSGNTTYAIQAGFDGRIYIPPVQIQTSTGGTGGGETGGGSSCPEWDELVDVQGKGQVIAGSVVAGDYIRGHSFKNGVDAYRRVAATSAFPCNAWRMIDAHRVTPCEPVWDTTVSGWTQAFRVARATFDTLIGTKVQITVDTDDYDEANYWLVSGTPLLVHNFNLGGC